MTFGASDMPLNARDLDAEGLLQFPTVVGGIAVVINVAGVAGGELVLDGPTIARIFSAGSGPGTMRRSASSIRT